MNDGDARDLALSEAQEAVHVQRFAHRSRDGGTVGGPDSFYNGMRHAEQVLRGLRDGPGSALAVAHADLTERAAAAGLFLSAATQTAWQGTDAPQALARRALAALRGDPDALDEYRAVAGDRDRDGEFEDGQDELDAREREKMAEQRAWTAALAETRARPSYTGQWELFEVRSRDFHVAAALAGRMNWWLHCWTWVPAENDDPQVVVVGQPDPPFAGVDREQSREDE